MIRLTHALILAGVSAHNGYSYRQYELLGSPAPWGPPAEWAGAAVGRLIPLADYVEFLDLRNAHLDPGDRRLRRADPADRRVGSLRDAVRVATAAPVPVWAAVRYGFQPDTVFVVSLCRAVAELGGGEPFVLPTRAAQAAAGVTGQTLGAILDRLHADGVLELIDRGRVTGNGPAGSTWRYVGCVPAADVPDSGQPRLRVFDPERV